MTPIERLRRALFARRRALLHQVEHVDEDLRHLDENVEIELEDEAQEENISRLLAGLDERAKAEIDAIDAALTRIAAGDYGRCEDCGERIPVERLEALPTTTSCLQCAEARERGAG